MENTRVSLLISPFKKYIKLQYVGRGDVFQTFSYYLSLQALTKLRKEVVFKFP